MDRPPALPPRTSASLPSRVTFEGPRTWRASLATFVALCLGFAVLIALIILSVYLWRDKAAYEELVDYLDKTISISKINYNPALGLYQLSEKELEVLAHQRTYKTILWLFLAAELGIFLFLGVAFVLYFSSDLSNKVPRTLFWGFFLIGCLYSVVVSHVFSFMLFPYSSTLPESTTKLLNHAVPHNPGGLAQMEKRLGCTFDYSLYSNNKRTENPRNTCDPQLASSFIPKAVLGVILGLQCLPLVLGVLLLIKKTPFSESIAEMVEKLKPVKKQHLYKKKAGASSEKKSTTFGVTSHNRGPATPLPPVPSPSVDHSISYNNAAFFATVGSSRGSEISMIHAHDLCGVTDHHGSCSIQSEV